MRGEVNSPRFLLLFTFRECRELFRTLLAKDLGCKPLDNGIFQPGIGREPGFAARLLQEADAVPLVLSRALRQQQTALHSQADRRPMPADLNFFRTKWVHR